ncbi:threonine ammonia-lyase IlvA [Rhodococcus sp. ACT016]|uniref:threonine ammonia-lyase IlvA n=1 Tax=Rhodococcus sp. ACT016 TaxID=3134808 RepID=UPI003D2DA538
MHAVVAAAVDEAASRLDGIIRRTPLERNARLSDMTGSEVWLKREDQQVVRSYKLRGAYNFIVQIQDEVRGVGVVCASAGNHAQGVAWACNHLGLPGRIYVPRTTPRQKRERIRSLGGDAVEIMATGETYDRAHQAASAHAETTGAMLVPAFDAPATIAGQGTIAREIVEQLGEVPNRVIVPIGGGGLLAGIAAWSAEHTPETQLIGVEAAGAASMTAALRAGHPVALESVDTFVDGAAVQTAGSHTFPLIRDHVARVTTVDEGRVCSEMLAMYQHDGIIAEPAGALATASLGDSAAPEPGELTVCVVSGGNNDVSRYSEVLERSLIHEGLKHYFLVDFPQQPGALRRFLDDMLGPDDDITMFEYVKRNNRETGPALVGIQVGYRGGLDALLSRMVRSRCMVQRIEPEDPLFGFVQ